MDDKYNTYDNVEFTYDYPYTWKKKNKKYLEDRDERRVNKIKSTETSQSIRRIIVND